MNPADAPRLVGGPLRDLSCGRDAPVVKGIEVADWQRGHMTVIARLGCPDDVGTAPEHEVDLAGAAEHQSPSLLGGGRPELLPAPIRRTCFPGRPS